MRRPAGSGRPQDFAALVDACHRAGLAVILDWVPGHFPDDPHGLAGFDGTALYEHADPRQGRHLDWDTLIYNFGRRRGRKFPDFQRAVLARLLWHRWPARRCCRIHALSRLQPAARRLVCQIDTAVARTSKRSSSFAIATPKYFATTPRRPPWPKNPPPGRWCHSRSTWAGSASATSGTWVDARHPQLRLQGADSSQASSWRCVVRSPLRILAKFRVAAVTR